MLTANAAFDEKELPVGRIFAASHSGSMIGSLLSRGKARGIGFAGPRLGRQRGRSVARRDLRGDARRSRHRRLHAVPRDHAPRRRAAPLRDRRRRARQAGRSPTSSAARRPRASLRYRIPARSRARTTSPTPSSPIAGSRAVETLDGLIEGAAAADARAGRATTRPSRSVGVVTTTGGGATMVVDPLGDARPRDRAAERRDAGAASGRRHRREAGAARRPHHSPAPATTS